MIISLKDLDDFIGYGAPVKEDRLLHWKKNDRKERAIIGLLLSDQHFEHVRDVEAAKQMWRATVDVLEHHDGLIKLSTRRKAYIVTMEHVQEMVTYLNRVKHLAATLKSMGVEIDGHGLAMAAPKGLPQMKRGCSHSRL